MSPLMFCATLVVVVFLLEASAGRQFDDVALVITAYSRGKCQLPIGFGSIDLDLGAGTPRGTLHGRTLPIIRASSRRLASLESPWRWRLLTG